MARGSDSSRGTKSSRLSAPWAALGFAYRGLQRRWGEPAPRSHHGTATACPPPQNPSLVTPVRLPAAEIHRRSFAARPGSAGRLGSTRIRAASFSAFISQTQLVGSEGSRCSRETPPVRGPGPRRTRRSGTEPSPGPEGPRARTELHQTCTVGAAGAVFSERTVFSTRTVASE